MCILIPQFPLYFILHVQVPAIYQITVMTAVYALQSWESYFKKVKYYIAIMSSYNAFTKSNI